MCPSQLLIANRGEIALPHPAHVVRELESAHWWP